MAIPAASPSMRTVVLILSIFSAPVNAIVKIDQSVSLFVLSLLFLSRAVFGPVKMQCFFLFFGVFYAIMIASKSVYALVIFHGFLFPVVLAVNGLALFRVIAARHRAFLLSFSACPYYAMKGAFTPAQLFSSSFSLGKTIEKQS